MRKPKPKTKRRPTADDFEPLFEMIGFEAMSLRAACEKLGLDAPSTIKAIRADEALNAAYDEAVELRGEYYGEKVAEVGLGALEGGEAGKAKYAPDQVRAAVDALKWSAARMARKRYGDRATVEHTGKDGGPIEVDETAAAARIAAILAAAEARRKAAAEAEDDEA